MGIAHTTNSEHTLTAFLKHARELYDEHKYVTWEPRIGADRSITQNGLFHAWLREYLAHKLKIDKREVTKEGLASIKRTVKKIFHRAYGYSWMVHTLTDYDANITKRDYTSSGDWKSGEMYLMLEFLQMIAAEDGCILEARGEHAKLKRESLGG